MRRALTASLVLVAVLLIPTFASAQTSIGDIGFSYSFHRLFDEGDSLNMPAGWLVSASKSLGRSPFAVVGEVAGSYRSESGETVRLYTYQGGLRISGSNPTVRPFAQFLVGTMHAGCGCGESATYFSIEPGGGVDVLLGRHASLRLGASLPTAFSEGDTGKSVRLQVGLSVPLGRR
jgi:hypothetical protein